jgi:hypothetical protein
MFQSDIASVSDDAKDWSDTEKNIPHLWLLNLQIRQGKYTLFLAFNFVGLRACIESSMTHEKFKISERKVNFSKRLD